MIFTSIVIDIGKRVLADEFFKTHAHELHNFGPQFANRSHSENVTKLATSHWYVSVPCVVVSSVVIISNPVMCSMLIRVTVLFNDQF